MLTAILAATYLSAQCGFAFEYPSSWTIAENPAAKVGEPGDNRWLATCAVGLRPPGWRKEVRESIFALQPYPVRVVKWNKPFVQAAYDAFFFRNEEGQWLIASRGTDTPVTHFTTRCCRGMRGTSWARIWSRDDKEVGSLIWEGAILNDRKAHTIIIESDRDEAFKEVVNRIIRTARFTK